MNINFVRKFQKIVALTICFVLLLATPSFAGEENLDISGSVVTNQIDGLKSDVKVENKPSLDNSENKTMEKVSKGASEDIPEDIIPLEDTAETEKMEIESSILQEKIPNRENADASEVVFDRNPEENVVAKSAIRALRGPAPHLTALYPFHINGEDAMGNNISENLSCGQKNGIWGDIACTTTKQYKRNTAVISVRRVGYPNGTFRAIASDGATVSIGNPYDIVLGSDGGALAWTADYEIQNVSPDVSETEFSIRCNPNSNGLFTRNVVIKWLDERAEGPATAQFVFNSAYQEGYQLSGVDSTMEYRIVSDSVWTTCTDNVMTFPAPEKEQEYLVRYKTQGETAESKPIKIVLKAKSYAPSLSYSTTTEKISGLTTEMEYSLDNEAYLPVSTDMVEDGISSLIDSIAANTAPILRICKKASTEPVSRVKEIQPYARREKSEGVQFSPETFTFTGVSTSMQYLVPEYEWTNFSSTMQSMEKYINNDKDLTIFVRMAPVSGKNSASLPTPFVLRKLAAAPEGLTIDFTAEKINGLTNNVSYEYRLSETSSWIAIINENGSFSVSNRIGSQERPLFIRKAKNGSVPPTAAVRLVLPARPTNPMENKFVYNDSRHLGKAVLIGLNSDLEFKLSTSTQWQTSTDELVFDLPSAMLTYQIRRKSSNNNFVSLPTNIYLLFKGSAPGCSYNPTTELLTGLNSFMEYCCNNKEYVDIANGTTSLDTSVLLDGLTGNYNIKIRYKDTQEKPSSREKEIILYPRTIKPASVTYDPGTFILKGVSATMEYKSEKDSSWKSISSTTVNLETYTNNSSHVKIFVRTKATTIKAASKSVEIIIPQLVPGPSGKIDYINETICDLEKNTAYQYRTSLSGPWNNIVNSQGKVSISKFIGNQGISKIYLRKASVGTIPATSATEFLLKQPLPTYAPDAKFIYNKITVPGKCILVGLTPAMEHKKSTETEWTSWNGMQVVLDLPSSDVTYQVRLKATATTFATSPTTFTLKAPVTEPITYLNSTTELIGNINNKMEWRIGVGEFTPFGMGINSMNVSDIIDTVSKGGNCQLQVRYICTETAPTSKIKTIILYGRLDTPTTPVFDKNTKMLSRVTTAMQYREEGTTSWNPISSAAVDLTKSINGRPNVVIEVRMQPTSKNSASKINRVNCF